MIQAASSSPDSALNQVDQLREFFPTGPNISIFAPLANPTSILLGILLGAVVVAGIVWTGVGLLQYASSGRNVERRGAGVDTMRFGGGLVLWPFIAAAVFAVIAYLIALFV